MNNTVLEVEVTSEEQIAIVETPGKQSSPDGPAALPAHILAVGDHHRLASSTWWIGYARPAYEEVSYLSGVVIYNRTTHIFLTQEEATEAQMLLPRLLQQGLSSLNA
jgi:hypothetical protein